MSTKQLTAIYMNPSVMNDAAGDVVSFEDCSSGYNACPQKCCMTTNSMQMILRSSIFDCRDVVVLSMGNWPKNQIARLEISMKEVLVSQSDAVLQLGLVSPA